MWTTFLKLGFFFIVYAPIFFLVLASQDALSAVGVGIVLFTSGFCIDVIAQSCMESAKVPYFPNEEHPHISVPVKAIVPAPPHPIIDMTITPLPKRPTFAEMPSIALPSREPSAVWRFCANPKNHVLLIVGVGIFLIGLMVAVPPWRSQHESAGYQLLFCAPKYAHIDLVRLGIPVAFVILATVAAVWALDRYRRGNEKSPSS